ncbi:MAG TPA: GBS Bsp-like repeat-containing protein [Candidatus Saccharimonadia bacterium]|nr:GBS Bsp-like repeat-containing protein [Candidatus Saccharimonadia bacterium]
MKKLLLTLFGVFILLCFVGAGLFLLPTGDAINFNIESQNTRRVILLSNPAAFSRWLVKLGYTKKNSPISVSPLDGTHSLDSVNVLNVIYTDQEQPLYHVMANGSLVSSAGFDYDNVMKKLTVRINNVKVPQQTEAEYAHGLETTTLDILWRINSAALRQDLSEQDWHNQYRLGGWSVYFLTSIPNLLSSIVPVAYAQSCVGSYQCGTYGLSCDDGSGTNGCTFVNQLCGSGFIQGHCTSGCVANSSRDCAQQFPGGNCSDWDFRDCTSPNNQVDCLIGAAGHCGPPSGPPPPPPNQCPNAGEYFCSAQGTCSAGCKNTGGLTCQAWLDANCNAPPPPPPPPVGCGTCTQNNCGNVCPGTACGKCDDGLTDCAWGTQNCTPPPPVPASPPTCSGSTRDLCVDKGGTISSSAIGVQNADSVFFPTWSNANGQDDIVWYTGTNNGGTWTASIPWNGPPAHSGGTITSAIWMHNNNSTPQDVNCSSGFIAVPCNGFIQGQKKFWNGTAYVTNAVSSAQTLTLNPGAGQTVAPAGLNYSFGPVVVNNANSQTVRTTLPVGCTLAVSLCYDDITCHALGAPAAGSPTQCCTNTNCSAGLTCYGAAGLSGSAPNINCSTKGYCQQPVNGTTRASMTCSSTFPQTCSVSVSDASISSNFDTVNDPFAYGDLWWHYVCPRVAPTCTSITPTLLTSGDVTSTSFPFTVHGVANAESVRLHVATNAGFAGGKTYAASISGGDISTWVANMDMTDSTLWAPTVWVRAEITNEGFTNYYAAGSTCNTRLNRQVSIRAQVQSVPSAAGVTFNVNNCFAANGVVTTNTNGTGAPTFSVTGVAGTTAIPANGGPVTIATVPLGTASKNLTLNLDPNSPTRNVMVCPANAIMPMTAPYTTPAQYQFFIRPTAAAWFSTIGGNAGAESAGNATAVKTLIPDTCLTTSCFLFRRNAAAANSSGFSTVGVGSSVMTHAAPTQLSKVSEEGYNVFAGSTRTSVKQDYAYFSQLYGLVAAPPQLNNIGNLQVTDLTTYKTANPTATSYYANGNVTITNAFTVPANTSYVIFVNNGNLTVNNTITVPVGSFLAFIVNGNITFGPTVGIGAPFASEVANVSGVYVAQNTLTVSASALKFVGDGTFVGWGGVSLNRDIGITNDTVSAEIFRGRADFAQTAPAEMKKSVYDWHEVAP